MEICLKNFQHFVIQRPHQHCHRRNYLFQILFKFHDFSWFFGGNFVNFQVFSGNFLNFQGFLVEISWIFTVFWAKFREFSRFFERNLRSLTLGFLWFTVLNLRTLGLGVLNPRTLGLRILNPRTPGLRISNFKNHQIKKPLKNREKPLKNL